MSGRFIWRKQEIPVDWFQVIWKTMSLREPQNLLWEVWRKQKWPQDTFRGVPAHDCRSWTGLVAPGTCPPVTVLEARSLPQREEGGISSTVLQKEDTTPRKLKLSFSPAHFSGLSVLTPREKLGERREKDCLSKYYSLWKVCKQGPSTVITT